MSKRRKELNKFVLSVGDDVRARYSFAASWMWATRLTWSILWINSSPSSTEGHGERESSTRLSLNKSQDVIHQFIFGLLSFWSECAQLRSESELRNGCFFVMLISWSAFLFFVRRVKRFKIIAQQQPKKAASLLRPWTVWMRLGFGCVRGLVVGGSFWARLG